jgi:hypothetical protein
MSGSILDLARTRALALSTVSAHQPLDRAATEEVIRRTMRRHGGVRGCAAALAQQYGEHPELAAPRMRWASQQVSALYQPAVPPRCVSIRITPGSCCAA